MRKWLIYYTYYIHMTYPYNSRWSYIVFSVQHCMLYIYIVYCMQQKQNNKYDEEKSIKFIFHPDWVEMTKCFLSLIERGRPNLNRNLRKKFRWLWGKREASYIIFFQGNRTPRVSINVYYGFVAIIMMAEKYYIRRVCKCF